MRSNPRAFTLIELLVVITIIVVLLALLTPALDKAVHQGDLAVCGARLKGLTNGALTYASAFNRRYPDRPNPWLAERIGYDSYDLRVVVAGYIDWKLFVDPLAPSPKLDLSIAAAPAARNPMSNYTLYFGFRYAGHPGMFRMGDRWSWTSDGRVNSFSLLATDQDRILRQSTATSTHNDAAESYGVFYDQEGASGVTIARWQLPPGVTRRAAQTLQFAYENGSVLRLEEMRMNDPLDGPSIDERLVRVSERDSGDYGNDDWNNLPRER